MSFIIESAWLTLSLIVLIIFVTWSVIKWRRQTSRLTPGTRLPPCLPAFPVVGSLPFMSSDMTMTPRFFVQQSAKYGNVFALYFGPRYALILNGYDTIREALLKKSVQFAGRVPFFAFMLLNPKRKGIASGNYDDEFRRKHQIYLSILKEFGFGQRLMETRINVEVDEFIRQARLIDGKAFDPKLLIHTSVMNVIGSILMARRYPSGHPILVELKHRLQSLPEAMVPELELFPFLRYMPSYRGRLQTFINAHRSLEELIQREINITLWDADHEEGDRNDSFVRRFVELTSTDGPVTSLTSATYDHEELLQLVMELFAAGQDTVASTLLWTLVNLANNPEIQSRLQKEMDGVLGNERLPLLDDELKLPYMQAVILEILRHSSVVPLALFHETTCDTQVGGYFIKKNTLVIANLYSAHVDPVLWSEPDVFRPERFLDECEQIINRNKILPFSLGKRSCFGESLARQELFLFLAGIVRNFDVLPPEGHQVVNAEPRWSVVMEPSSFCIRLVPRQR